MLAVVWFSRETSGADLISQNSREIAYVEAVDIPPTPKPMPRLVPPVPRYYAVVDPEVTEYIGEVFGVHAETALAVAKCESGFNPYVVNDNPRTGDYSVGVFQINIYGSLALNRPSEAWLKDYKNNINHAYKMFQSRGGWKDWTCHKG